MLGDLFSLWTEGGGEGVRGACFSFAMTILMGGNFSRFICNFFCFA